MVKGDGFFSQCGLFVWESSKNLQKRPFVPVTFKSHRNRKFAHRLVAGQKMAPRFWASNMAEQSGNDNRSCFSCNPWAVASDTVSSICKRDFWTNGANWRLCASNSSQPASGTRKSRGKSNKRGSKSSLQRSIKTLESLTTVSGREVFIAEAFQRNIAQFGRAAHGDHFLGKRSVYQLGEARRLLAA